MKPYLSAIILVSGFVCIIAILSIMAINTDRIIYVVDGDTIETSEGTVRIAGIDAPETDQCYGDRATQFLEGITDERVTLKQAGENRGHYGRLIRYVHDNGDVGAEMLKRGYAYASNFKHPRKPEYDRLEERAKQHNRGLWQTC